MQLQKVKQATSRITQSMIKTKKHVANQIEHQYNQRKELFKSSSYQSNLSKAKTKHPPHSSSSGSFSSSPQDGKSIPVPIPTLSLRSHPSRIGKSNRKESFVVLGDTELQHSPDPDFQMIQLSSSMPGIPISEFASLQINCKVSKSEVGNAFSNLENAGIQFITSLRYTYHFHNAH
jgi:hypothetical protein